MEPTNPSRILSIDEELERLSSTTEPFRLGQLERSLRQLEEKKAGPLLHDDEDEARKLDVHGSLPHAPARVGVLSMAPAATSCLGTCLNPVAGLHDKNCPNYTDASSRSGLSPPPQNTGTGHSPIRLRHVIRTTTLFLILQLITSPVVTVFGVVMLVVTPLYVLLYLVAQLHMDCSSPPSPNAYVRVAGEGVVFPWTACRELCAKKGCCGSNSSDSIRRSSGGKRSSSRYSSGGSGVAVRLSRVDNPSVRAVLTECLLGEAEDEAEQEILERRDIS